MYRNWSLAFNYLDPAVVPSKQLSVDIANNLRRLRKVVKKEY